MAKPKFKNRMNTMLIIATDFCYTHIHAVFMEMAHIRGKETASYCRFAYLHSKFSLVTLNLAGIFFIGQLLQYLRYVEVWHVKRSTDQLGLGGLHGYRPQWRWTSSTTHCQEKPLATSDIKIRWRETIGKKQKDFPLKQNSPLWYSSQPFLTPPCRTA